MKRYIKDDSKEYIYNVVLVTIASILITVMAIIIAEDSETRKMQLDRYSNNINTEVIIKC